MCVMRAIRGCMSVPEGDPVDITFPFPFFSCAAWGPAPRPPVPRASEPGTPRLVCTVVGNPPRGTRPGGQGPLPPEGRKWFDFDITGHQRRKHRLGFVDRNAPGSAPRIWLRLCEGDRLDPTDSSYDAEFWLRGGSTLVAPGGQCRCAHAAHCTCGWGGTVAPRKGRALSMYVSESSPLQGLPWQGTCPPCAQGFQGLEELGAAGGCWGGRGFYSMVLEEKSRQRGGNSSGGQEANFGGIGGLGDSHAVCVSMSCVSVCLLPLPQCLCYCRILQDLLFELPRLGTY